jgi:hypothetical protein
MVKVKVKVKVKMNNTTTEMEKQTKTIKDNNFIIFVTIQLPKTQSSHT